ncbi:MAG: hypothetical protein ACKPHU_29975, partial [Planctomycetaceae bacterium]
KLDQLLQDSQWAAGLDTKIVSVTEPDSQTRQIEIAPGTGYDALQLAGRLSEQTGLQVVVRLVAADEGGVDLEISTAETQLVVIYPVYMYAHPQQQAAPQPAVLSARSVDRPAAVH